METLPADLITTLLHYVQAARSPLAPLAAISRPFRDHVEAITFRNLTIGPSDLDYFRSIITSSRFHAVRKLIYHIPGNTDAHNDGRTRISRQKIAEYSKELTVAIRDLLVLLKHLSVGVEDDHPGLHVELKGANYMAESMLYVEQAPDEEYACERAWLELLNDEVPQDIQVPVVTYLKTPNWQGHNLCGKTWPPCFSALAGRFPRLKELDLWIDDNPNKARDCRLRARNAFGLTLSQLPSSLNALLLNYPGFAPKDQKYPAPRLTDPVLGYDIFSHELGLLTRRLNLIYLSGGILDLTHFFNTVATASTSSSPFDNLECIYLVDLEICSADGPYYFDVDPDFEPWAGEGNSTPPTQDHLRRSVLNEDNVPEIEDLGETIYHTLTSPAQMEPVYVAVAEAAKSIPTLGTVSLEFVVPAHPGVCLKHHFEYSDGIWEGGRRRWGGKTCGDNVLVGWTLEPMVEGVATEAVVEAWKEVGVVKGGKDVDFLVREEKAWHTDVRAVG